MTLVNAVRRARAERGLSQGELAELARTSRQTVAAVESGASVPSVELALRLARVLDRPVGEIFRLSVPEDAPRRALVVAGSDDPGLALLAERLRERGRLLLSLSTAGSSGGLASLAAGTADAAGIHLDDNLARARAIVSDAALLHLARREQGVLLRGGARLRRVADLAGLRLALRQPGSGTRALFERVVPRGLARRVVAELPTHDQVAAAVLRGDADAGTATRATANRYGLAFFPLAWERFDLALRRELLDDPRVLALRAALAERATRRAIEALGGYDLAEAGALAA